MEGREHVEKGKAQHTLLTTPHYYTITETGQQQRHQNQLSQSEEEASNMKEICSTLL